MAKRKKVWNVVEVGIEGGVGNFGPFDSLQEAADFVSSSQFPDSGDFISKVKIESSIVND